MYQQRLWESDICRYCNKESESDTRYVLYCSYKRLSKFHESIIETFMSNCAWLDRDEQIIDLLLKVIIVEEITPLPHLRNLFF